MLWSNIPTMGNIICTHWHTHSGC